MKRLQVAVIGFGKVGQACAAAILADEQLALAGIVRRRESLSEHLPSPFSQIAVVAHASELGRIDAALLCVPTGEVLATARELLQHRIPVVECATLHGEALQLHHEELNRSAVHHKVPVIVGAGWDPGALSLFRALFALLTPRGHTETSWHTGSSLHHTTAARDIPGVREALATEMRRADGSVQRYVYVEIEKGGELAKIEAALRCDPLFLDEETLVFPVEDIRQLEEEGYGVLLERHGSAAATPHQRLLLEARYAEPALCAAVMTAAARALPGCRHRAYSLLEMPLGDLWGDLQDKAKKEWL
jgi:diaminopimelate dehydrogenase